MNLIDVKKQKEWSQTSNAPVSGCGPALFSGRGQREHR